MTDSKPFERLVVVHGTADPVLAATLSFVGLQVVHAGGDITVWAPAAWDLPWSLQLTQDPALQKGAEAEAWDLWPERQADYLIP